MQPKTDNAEVVNRQTAGLLTALALVAPVLNTWRVLADNPIWQALAATEECSPQYLQSVTGRPLNRISEQLNRLLAMGLVSVRAYGKYRLYAVRPDALSALNAFCGHFTGEGTAYQDAYAFVWALNHPLRLKLYSWLDLFGSYAFHRICEVFELSKSEASGALKPLRDNEILRYSTANPIGAYYEVCDVGRKIDAVRRLAVQVERKFS